MLWFFKKTSKALYTFVTIVYVCVCVHELRKENKKSSFILTFIALFVGKEILFPLSLVSEDTISMKEQLRAWIN